MGEDDRHITDIDEGGVALAAIQGLNQRLEDELRNKDAELAAQREQVRQQEREIHEPKEAVRELSKRGSFR